MLFFKEIDKLSDREITSFTMKNYSRSKANQFLIKKYFQRQVKSLYKILN